MTIASILNAIEKFAPTYLQESWDNTGVQVGTRLAECTGVMVCLDPTPEVIDEAIAKNCNLVISHHPLFFRPVKQLTGETPMQAAAINAIAAGITVYSTHTASDSAEGGVSYLLAKRLGIEPLRPLSPAKGLLAHLRVMVPTDKAEEVRMALFDAGAGAVGRYDCCSFNVEGKGTFRALDGADPYVGAIGENHIEPEVAVDVVLPAAIIGKVEKALLDVHPYETPAYQFTSLLNASATEGLGVYGISEEELTPIEFVKMVKERLNCYGVRTTPFDPDSETKIRRVAVCGGAGGEFIAKAVTMGAQAYVSADIRYHDFVDFRDQILLIDAGHYDTEAPVKQLLADLVKDNFPTVPVYATTVADNPIRFY